MVNRKSRGDNTMHEEYYYLQDALTKGNCKSVEQAINYTLSKLENNISPESIINLMNLAERQIKNGLPLTHFVIR